MSRASDVDHPPGSWRLELARGLALGALGLLLTALAHGLHLRRLPSFESSEERQERIRREVQQRLEALRRARPAPTPAPSFDELWGAASVPSSSRSRSPRRSGPGDSALAPEERGR